MIVFDIPQWLVWLLTSGIAFCFWAIAVAVTMMIGSFVNKTIYQWWTNG